MVVLDTYYQLHERETANVSGVWKACHLMGLLTAGTCSIIAAIHFGHVLIGFSHNCILYTSIAFLAVPQPDPFFNIFPSNMKIESHTTVWNDDFHCNYCTFSWIISFIIAVVLFTFIFMNSTGGRGYETHAFSQPWRLVYPSLVISIIMTFVTGFAAITSIRGFGVFCRQFAQYIGKKRCTEDINIYTLLFNKKIYPVDNSIDFVQLCSSISWCGWIFVTVTFLLRVWLAPDFYVLVVKTEHKKSHATTKTTNFTLKDENSDDQIRTVSSEVIKHELPKIQKIDAFEYIDHAHAF